MWSVTAGPYEVGTHYYGFLIDGVLTGDLGGTAVTDRLSRGFLLFESIDVRGPEPLFTDIRPVPHGTIHIETFGSRALQREVRCFVYTPPGWLPGEQLPVVYLLHGDLHDAAAWSTTGYAERIADNLIAGGQARRVLLSMPDTGTDNRRNLPTDVVEPYLISEVFPFVEASSWADQPPSVIWPGSPPAQVTHAIRAFAIRRSSEGLAFSVEAVWRRGWSLKTCS